MDNFEQTVNLRKKIVEQKRANRAITDSQISKMREEKNQPFSRIDQPNRPRVNENLIKTIVWIIAIIVVGVVVSWLFFNNGGENEEMSKNWYAVKLVNGDVFYGKVLDTESDPVLLTNVYYNYEQDKDGKNTSEETGNLRLVKRGQETHGPAGEMSIVRVQVLYMEPLKTDSNVLKAILDYEK